MKLLSLIICFAFVVPKGYGQESKEKAIHNFKSFFNHFKNAYPVDRNKDSFKDYSDLWLRKNFPEELKMMIAYKAPAFYTEYLDHIKYSRDTLIKIDSLNLSKEVKEVYGKFKKSIEDGSKKGKYNDKQDKIYSEKLRGIINQQDPPLIGYYQTVTVIMEAPDGQKEEVIMLITYNNSLEVIDFGRIEK